MKITTEVKVTAYHCDQMDHVNNTVYVDLLYDATYEIVSPELRGYLTVETLRLDYVSSAHYGENLLVSLWVTGNCEAHYEITDHQGTTYTRARVLWKRPPIGSGYWDSAGDHITPPFTLKQGNNNIDKTKGRPFELNNYVYLHDLTSAGFVKPSSFIRWTEEASEASALKRGWPTSKMIENNWMSFAVSQDLQVFEVPSSFSRLSVVSYLHDFRQIRGVWRHDVVDMDSKQLIARNFIGGAFISLSGELTPAPPGLLENCLLGEP